MDFKYYQGEEAMMLGLREDALPCSFCGQVGPGFQIECEKNGEVEWESGFYLGVKEKAQDLPILAARPEDSRDPDFFHWGCMACLRQGRFTVWHDTDAGEIEAGGVLEEKPYNQAFTPESAQELSRTPSFSTFQQAIWLTHCDDFMAYLGEWGRDEFNASTGDGDGRVVFAAVSQDLGMKVEEWDKLRGYGLYLFRCLHCGKMRSFSDWD